MSHATNVAAFEFAPVLFGLLSALSWGAGDFCGGLASRRTGVYAVVVTSQIIGTGLLLGSALAFGETFPPFSDLLWGASAGVAGAVGLLALYRGLSSGRMGLVAPVSAVGAAALPVVVAAFLQGLPGALTLIGFVMALVGIWLLSRPESSTTIFRLNDLGLPLVAGIGFGLFFVLIDRASEHVTFWPLVAARLASVTFVTLSARTSHQPLAPERSQIGLVALSGILDAGGNTFFSLAVQSGRLDVASVLSSLYPASTVALAWLILKERLSRWQWVGVAATLTAIALIAIPAPAPAMAQALKRLNCQLADLPSGGLRFVSDPSLSAAPEAKLFNEDVIRYTRTTFNEKSLTYQTSTCVIVTFIDEAAAARALEQACHQAQSALPLTPVGEEACSFGEGVVSLNFRRAEALVLITADLNGAYIYQLAAVVDNRLK